MTYHDYRHLSSRRQLFYLFLLWIGCTIIGMALSLGIVALIYGRDMAANVLFITHTNAPGFIGGFRIFIALGNTLCVFLAPALVFSYLIVREPDEYIGPRNYFSPLLLLVVIAFMLFFLPVVDITGYFNQKMTLPSSMASLEKWIRDTEEQNGALLKIILDMKTTGDYLVSVLIVALFPAIAEEFFFRGCMQRIFEHMTKNLHASVWITAFIFSFMHFEFLGFLPRFLLGAGLGYLYVWSGSIWPSVLAHFLNNGFAVTGLYLYQHKLIAGDPDNGQPMFSQMWIYAISLIISILVLLVYRKIALANQVLITDGEELD
jgi:membrane protease YdiL (CAAX protease family)